MYPGINAAGFRAIAFLPLFLVLIACQRPGVIQTPTPAFVSRADQEQVSPTPAPSATRKPSPTARPTRRPSPSPSPSPSPTVSRTPTISPSPTISPTPTFDFPDVEVLMQANCRYGPGTAYLYSHGLYPGDRGEVHGRNYSGTWLWIQPENLDRHCWAAASVVEIEGDIFTVRVFRSRLPFTTFIGPPTGVIASRDGDQVTISWNPVNVNPPEDSRGYLLELTVCQSGLLIPLAAHTDTNSYSIRDEGGCSGDSGGRLYAVEKHGYTDPVGIDWP